MLIELILLGGGVAAYVRQRNKPNTKATGQSLAQPNKVNKAVAPGFSSKKLLQDLKTALLGDERQQQQLTLNPDMRADIEKYEKEAGRNFRLSVVATGLDNLSKA